jgi:ectoine hydroxylase-related dioxygenase (phytanoyl-CoA dioxygenase family)
VQKERRVATDAASVSEDFDPGPCPAAVLAVRLSDEQIDQFHRDGFTSVARITTEEELAWLRPIYDHLFATKGTFQGGYFDLSRPYESDGLDLVPQVLSPELRFPQLLATNTVRNARAIAAQLLERDPAELETWSHLILKPPHVGGALPWHQDEAYWDTRFAYRALGCWVPLDPATIDSGCMHFLPGTHTGPVRPHRHIGDDPNIHGIELIDPPAADDAIAVPLAPGGATFHHCRTFHMTTPNVSDRVRRAWGTEVQIQPRLLAADGRPDHPWMRETEAAWRRRALGDGAARGSS